ncbi:MAG: M1 family metallopeptidase [Phycisphaerales bacterium]
MSVRTTLIVVASGLLATVSLFASNGCARMRSSSEQRPQQRMTSASVVSESPRASYLRNPAPRAPETIFSELPLPPANEVRLGSGAPGPEYWQQRVDYDIEATLDAENEHLTGRATITYTNNSPHPLDYLWIHLEQNLFRQDSVATMTSEPGARFSNRDFNGGYTIGAVRTGDGEELDFHIFDVLGRIDLPEPLDPRGDQFVFEIEWDFQVPQYGIDRMGIEEVSQGKVFQFAQWFPAVAVYDDYYGWNTLPYLGQGEFYTNFGDYTIALTVPGDHLVDCTGTLENPEEVLTEVQLARLEEARNSAETVIIRGADEVDDPISRPAGTGPLTWRFQAEDVRTVAWASSDAFIWDASFIEDSGPTGPDGEMTGTLVQSLYPVEGLPIWADSTAMLHFAIVGYNEKWYPYPYPVATNVNGIVGGMEYPMILFCRGRRSERSLWGVTTHEIAHNWFPMVVNTDERRHSWMDEGLATFVNYYSDREYFPEDDVVPNDGEGRGKDMAEYMARPDRQPIMTFHDQIRESGATQYWKPEFGLVLLRDHILGPERFDYAFREYIRRWAFKSPRPADFFRTMNDAAGADLDWFWRGWFYEAGTLDQGVARVDQSADGEVRVTFRNHDDLVMPVNYRVTYDDGSVEDRVLPVEAWHTTDEWTVGWNAGDKRVTEVWIDPKYHFPDVNRENNRWRAPRRTHDGPIEPVKSDG